MRKLLQLLAWIAGGLVLIGVILRLTLFESWTIPDDPWLAASLQPTLGAGDTVLVLVRGTAGFGDLVRCPDPEDANRFVAGRIVGVAGDNVELTGRTLLVNGKPFNASEACTEHMVRIKHPETGHEMEIECSRVELAGGWHFRGVLPNPSNREDVKKEVGEGKVFLMSDNRDLHDDSRDFGTVPHDGCNQRIVFRLWGPAGWSDSVRRMTVIR